jgi:hypothetical protein
MVLRNDQQHAQTRFLLALWDLSEGQEQSPVARGDVMPRAKRSKETSADFEPIIEGLQNQGAIAIDGNTYKLLPQAKKILAKSLMDEEFEYDSNVGAKTVNALLKWIRQGSVASVAAMNGSNGKGTTPIESYKEFTQVALDTYDQLNRDYNLDNLVPIYRIRRHIGDRLSRSQFNDWMLAMQVEDVFQFLEGTVEDSAPDKLEDSITTKFGKLRCYAKRLNA